MACMKKVLLGTSVVAIAAGAWWYTQKNTITDTPPFRTAKVEKGSITRAVQANGTLNPVVLVNVGTQVSGTIAKLMTDFNQPVKQGQILAELDATLIQANLSQLRANLTGNKSQLMTAERKLLRTQDLIARGFVSPAQLDTDKDAVDSLKAQQAAILAQVQREEANLRFSVIRSPINGVVIARNVDLGQTVAASFQTPTLFQIAQDLSQMQIDTSVPEADIGSLKVGMPATFTVDAINAKSFNATIKQIRLNPTVAQNVVTYNVVLAAANTEGVLLPGMTAHVRVVIDSKDEVLKIPNVALRFKPEGFESKRPTGERKKPDAPADGSSRPKTEGQKGRLFVWKDNKPTPVYVKLGITDNNMTELLDNSLPEGSDIIVGERADAKGGPPKGFSMRMF